MVVPVLALLGAASTHVLAQSADRPLTVAAEHSSEGPGAWVARVPSTRLIDETVLCQPFRATTKTANLMQWPCFAKLEELMSRTESDVLVLRVPSVGLNREPLSQPTGTQDREVPAAHQ